MIFNGRLSLGRLRKTPFLQVNVAWRRRVGRRESLTNVPFSLMAILKNNTGISTGYHLEVSRRTLMRYLKE